MAQTYVPFNGIQPAAATNTTIYTAGGGLQYAIVGWLNACNITKAGAGQDDSIRIYVVPSGQAVSDRYAIVIDMTVDSFDPYMANTPIVLRAGDFLVVYSTNGNIAFNGSALEVT